MDPKGSNASQCKDVIQNIAISYYNDAVIGVKVKGEIKLVIRRTVKLVEIQSGLFPK